MLPLHGKLGRVEGEDVHHANQAPQRSHVEDCYADSQEACRKSNFYSQNKCHKVCRRCKNHL